MREILKKPIDYIKEGFSNLSESLSEGWEYLMKNTRTALTKFKKSDDEWDIPDIPPVRWGYMANDIYCTDDEIIVRLELPGMDREDLNVMAYENYLVVSGEKKRQREEKRGDYYLSQCAYGQFYRTIPLPYRAKSEGVKAKYKNGVLMVRIPYEVTRKVITIN
mgnify:FL=1